MVGEEGGVKAPASNYRTNCRDETHKAAIDSFQRYFLSSFFNFLKGQRSGEISKRSLLASYAAETDIKMDANLYSANRAFKG